jgi:hypothetical protein
MFVMRRTVPPGRITVVSPWFHGPSGQDCRSEYLDQSIQATPSGAVHGSALFGRSIVAGDME